VQNIPKEPGERRARPHDLVVPISEKRGDKRRERRREGLVYGLEEFNTERIRVLGQFRYKCGFSPPTGRYR